MDSRFTVPRELWNDLAVVEVSAGKVENGWQETISLEYCIDRWRLVIGRLGSNSILGEEWAKLLSYRNKVHYILQEANRLKKVELLTYFGSVIGQLDEEFLRRSEPLPDGVVVGSAGSNPMMWWTRRVPFEKDVRAFYNCPPWSGREFDRQFLDQIEGSQVVDQSIGEGSFLVRGGDSFVDEDLRGFRFHGADLHGVHFLRCKLDRVDLRNACLSQASFTDSRILFSNLADAELTNANLIGCDISGSSFRSVSGEGLVIRSTKIRFCDLEGGLFTEAAVQESVIQSSSLFKTDWASADFGGSRLEHLRISNANFRSADLKRTAVGEISTKGHLGKGHPFDSALTV